MNPLIPLCIYHGGCDDGYGAAMAVWQATDGEVELFPAAYNKPPPLELAIGRLVYVVDFSYKREPMRELAEVAERVVVYDHHKTALDEIGPMLESGELAGEFDMERSGAMITWQALHTRVPRLVDYIQDRDLWRKELPGGDEVTFALRSYPQDPVTWAELLGRNVHELMDEGLHIHRYYRTLVDTAMNRVRIGWVPGPDGPMSAAIVNCDYSLASEVAGEACEKHSTSIGICFYMKSSRVWGLSVRSRGTGHARRFAEQFGGGGHDDATGCEFDELPRWLLDTEAP